MKNNLYIKDVLKITNGKLIRGNDNVICHKFSKDTRTINVGDVYIGIKGENFDGNLFWKQAIEKGADTLILEENSFNENEINQMKEYDANIILVKNTLDALYEIATYKRSLYNIPVIAITGSVGKTSTKDIIYSVVSQKYKTLKTQGNNNNNIGMPMTILNLDNEEAIVLEMGMNHLGEISLLSKIAKPTISVIINIGTAHIGNLGSKENILKAKLEILDGMKEPVLIINNDDELLHKWNNEKNNYTVYTYGIKNESMTKAKNIKFNSYCSDIVCQYKDEDINIEIPVGGEHFVYNALCAVTVGKLLNIENEKIINGIKNVELTKNRMDIILNNGVKIIDDSYNASYESMKALLEYLGKIEGNRKIAVLGDMLELGGYSEELHRKVGKEVVKNKIDFLICLGEKSKFIMEQALIEGMEKRKIYYEKNLCDLIKRIKEIIRKDDVVLIKASRDMGFRDIIKTIIK